MLSKAERRVLLGGGILIVAGILLLVDRSVALSPWVWAGFLVVAGLGALGLYLVDRTDGPMLLAAYLLGATAGLLVMVPTDLLRNEASACYVLLAIALPFLAIFLRDRARWWALIPAYPLLVVAGAVGLAASGLVSDELISAFVVLALALPFLAVFARDRKQWWALIPGGIPQAARPKSNRSTSHRPRISFFVTINSHAQISQHHTTKAPFRLYELPLFAAHGDSPPGQCQDSPDDRCDPGAGVLY